MNKTEPYKSPDGKHKIELLLAGEIRFGPEYYSVALNGQTIIEKIFGRPYKWDSESKYLALQEWLTTDYQKGPITALLVIDLKENKLAQLSIAEKGFIMPIRFDEDKVIYKKEYSASGQIKEYELELKTVTNWI
ncbi:hypothetical protein [Rufibacter sp. XAAS-G3-1]|uniref:hypothetical protein n=1 Tax=Rufibacter sp. XAAS-G3-1 TaxID=2729134 RepID=UPI0015E7AB00|nr:hypothetical protein [Rufibacter sp. XAAS-G3-1]